MSPRFATRASAMLLGGVAVLAAACADDVTRPPSLDASAKKEAPVVDPTAPAVLDPKLEVVTWASGLQQPTTMAFVGPGEALVLEKATGRVQHVRDGVVQNVALDLAVNSASERGLLGIALHADFPSTPAVFLYWTESSTGADSPNLADVPLRGNRVDRFVWNGTTLTQDGNIVRLRSFQADVGQPLRGNHNGGIVTTGPDGKLYVFIGDNGRRGWLQNLPCGPTPTCPGPTVPDDQFGGPQPDAAHLTGVILRFNPDGSTPTDNPFYAAGAALGGEVGASVQQVFSYGHRNGFGMAFDARSGELWLAENGDDSFSELNRVGAAANGGWVQVMGPIERVAQFREIETSTQFFGLQQIRWSPVNIATTPAEALSRLFMLPGAHYMDPEFSWKFEVAPAAVGFVDGNGLGGEYRGDLIIGAARPTLEGGQLFRFELDGAGKRLQFKDARLADRVADNVAKFEITESESLLWGVRFGVGTDIRTGPDGNLYVVSLSNGKVYAIRKRDTPRE